MLALLHLGLSFWTATKSVVWTGGNSARSVGSMLGLFVIGVVVAFGVVQVWRGQRSGLVVLGGIYLTSTAALLPQLYAGHGSWVGLALRGLVLAILLSPQAWRVGGKPQKVGA